MFLSKISVQNFRGIENLNIDFKTEEDEIRKWTLILGENGTGKSNLLKAIALVTAGSDSLGELLGNPADWISYDKNKCLIEATIENQEGEKRDIRLEINRNDKISGVIKKNSENLELLDSALGYTSRNYFLVGYGALRRLKDSKSFTRSENFFDQYRSRRIGTLFNRDVTLNSIESWALDLHYQEEEKGLEIIRKSLNEFLPEVFFDRIDKKNKKLIFKTPNGKMPLDFLSDGYQNMVGWLGDLLYQITETFGDYSSPLDTRGVLLIDEIELHLHPNWQRRLIQYLEKMLPNFQIITTTHAPLTAQQAPKDSLFFIRRDESQKLHLEKFVGDPRLVRIEQLLRTPAFGISTIASMKIETQREKYDKLKTKSNKSASEQKEFKKIAKFLKDIPDPSYKTTEEKKQINLLERIEKHLNSKNE